MKKITLDTKKFSDKITSVKNYNKVVLEISGMRCAS